MFLSKKNAIYFNKPKPTQQPKPKRILGGWQDSQEQKQDAIDYTKKQQIKPKPITQNLLQGDDIITQPITNNKQSSQKQIKTPSKEVYYLDWDELDAKNDMQSFYQPKNRQCEKKLVQEIVQPGGIRIKPSEAQLGEFLKQVKGMEVHVVGSLLLSKIQVNYPFQVKAKALYTIQHLVKKNQKYAAYFKAHSQKLRDFPQPEDNIDNYKKIIKQTLNAIGINAPSFQNTKNQPQLTFVDPGYNDEPTKKVTDMKTFINENAKKQKKAQPKRAIIGPGQAKKAPTGPKSNDDILGLDLLGTSTSQQGNSSSQQKLPQVTLTFDQLLVNTTNQHQKGTNFMGGDLI